MLQSLLFRPSVGRWIRYRFSFRERKPIRKEGRRCASTYSATLSRQRYVARVHPAVHRASTPPSTPRPPQVFAILPATILFSCYPLIGITGGDQKILPRQAYKKNLPTTLYPKIFCTCPGDDVDEEDCTCEKMAPRNLRALKFCGELQILRYPIKAQALTATGKDRPVREQAGPHVARRSWPYVSARGGSFPQSWTPICRWRRRAITLWVESRRD